MDVEGNMLNVLQIISVQLEVFQVLARLAQGADIPKGL